MERLCTLADNGGHTPDHEISRNWQESFFLSWYDAQSQSGGYQHVDIQPFKNRACVWSWIAARGRIVSRYQSLNLALPTTDISNFTAGPITVETLEPLARYRMTTAHPELGGSGRTATEDVVFQAFTQPLYLAMDEQGQPLAGSGKVGVSDYQSGGSGHYETIGKVTGTITDFDGTQTPVNGFGMQDHSWGVREYGGLTAAHRFVHCAFGPDLFASLYAMAKDQSDHSYGYVYDNGTYHRVSQLEIDVVVGRDGHTPKSCEVRMWSPTGRGYVFTGEGAVSSVSSHDGGFFGTDAYGEFRCGGRRGSGLIGLRERSQPSTAERAWLEAHDTGTPE